MLRSYHPALDRVILALSALSSDNMDDAVEQLESVLTDEGLEQALEDLSESQEEARLAEINPAKALHKSLSAVLAQFEDAPANSEEEAPAEEAKAQSPLARAVTARLTASSDDVPTDLEVTDEEATTESTEEEEPAPVEAAVDRRERIKANLAALSAELSKRKAAKTK